MPLTDKQQRFCDEYQISFNATDAAIKAGYSKKTAYSIGQENLKKPEIQDYLSKRKESLANKLQITQEMILEGYRKLAFYDSRKFYDENGNILNVPDLDDETAFALSGFEVMEEKGGNGQGQQVVLGYTKKIKMSDRRSAMDSICRVLGFNAAEKREITGKDGEALITPMTDNQVDKIISTLRALKNETS